MLYPSTNYTEIFRELFGFSDGESILDTLKIQKGKPAIISNPVLSALIKTYVPENKIPPELILTYEDTDMGHCKIAGHILRRVRPDLEKSENYINQLKRQILYPRGGAYYSALNEVFVGSYLKFLGYKVKFNSSQEKGCPDIEVQGKKNFAIDVKLFPDSEYEFNDFISSKAIKFFELLSKTRNISIILMISDISSAAKKTILPELEKFLNTGKHTNGEMLRIMVNGQGFTYAGTQGIVISSKNVNSSIRFIASIPMMEEKFTELTDKASKQIKKASNQGMTWIFFPNNKKDQNVHIGRRVLWEATNLASDIQAKGNCLALYELGILCGDSPSQWNIKSGIDMVSEEESYPGVNKETFNKYLSELTSTKTIFLS